MSVDLPVIYSAHDMGEADIVLHWLAERGIEAMIKDRLTAGTLQVPQIVAPHGIEVCALNAAQADDARDMLRQQFDKVSTADAARSDEPVDAVCEECGKTTSFAGTLRGRVEQCGHCNAYIDVPS